MEWKLYRGGPNIIQFLECSEFTPLSESNVRKFLTYTLNLSFILIHVEV